jgi:hypothetical protein
MSTHVAVHIPGGSGTLAGYIKVGNKVVGLTYHRPPICSRRYLANDDKVTVTTMVAVTIIVTAMTATTTAAVIITIKIYLK